MLYLSAVFGENPAKEYVDKESTKGDKTLWLFGRVQSKKYSQSHQNNNKQNPENNKIKSNIFLPKKMFRFMLIIYM